MRYTLNQVKILLERIATEHQQINEFGFGDIWEVDSIKEYSFPLMWGVLKPADISDKIVELNIDLLFMDLVSKDEGNETEVLSDMLQVALDVRAWLNDDDLADYFTIDVSNRAEPFTEKFDVEVSGWMLSIRFKIIDLKDRCAIPLES